MNDPAYPRPYGRYELLEPLGSGGMSAVDLARRSLDAAGYVRFCVIKRVHSHLTGQPGFVRMFQDEARISAELQHENIAQVYDFGKVGDEWYLAMEYVAGTDLYGLLRSLRARGDALPMPITLRVLHDVLAALHYAHTRADTYGQPMNIVHRDVNPRNVMISLRGEVKLIDFGVAKADNRAQHTEVHTIKGKFAYMAPEQLHEDMVVDGRADLFAVGIMLHELVSGGHPWSGLGQVQVMHKVLTAAFPELLGPGGHPADPALVALAHRALQPDRDDRFASAEEFRRALVSVADAVGGLASRSELAGFLRRQDPGAHDTIAERLESWRSQTGARAGIVHSATIADPLALPEPGAGPSSPTMAPDAERAEATDRPPLSRGVFVATALAAAAATLVGAAVLAVALVEWGPQPEAPTVPAPGQPAAPLEPAPTASAAPEAAPPSEPGPAATEAASAPAPRAASPASSQPARPPPERASAPSAPAPTPEPERPPEAAAAPPEAAAPEPVAVTPTPEAAAPTPEAATPAPEQPAATDFGYLYATTHPSSGYEVLVNGEVVGTTPLRNHKLAVGSYTVQLRDPTSGATSAHSARIDKGKPTMIKGTSR